MVSASPTSRLTCRKSNYARPLHSSRKTGSRHTPHYITHSHTSRPLNSTPSSMPYMASFREANQTADTAKTYCQAITLTLASGQIHLPSSARCC